MRFKRKDYERINRISETPPNEIVSVYMPGGEQGCSSIRAPVGLKESIDALLGEIHKSTGAKFSRNEFFIKAAKFYLFYLMKANSRKELVHMLESDPEENS